MNSCDQMIHSALQRLKWIDSHAYAGKPLWFAVSDLFGLGSTSAHALCLRFAVDPSEILPESSMQKAARLCDAEMNDELQGTAEALCKVLDHISEAVARD